MQPGIYKASFRTALGEGTGIVVLDADGNVKGGDDTLFYVGTVSQSGSNVAADFMTGSHTKIAGQESVFGRDIVHCNVRGQAEGDKALLSGTALEAPGVPFQVILERVGP